MQALTVGAARVRAGSWKGRDDLAYLVPVSPAATLTTSALHRIRQQLRQGGFETIITGAVGPAERDRLRAAGFVEHESLHLLKRNLAALPPRPRRSAGIRRGTAKDRRQIPDLDETAFDDFWRMDTTGLNEALRATPTSRMRVVRDPDLIAYSVVGRARTQGYIQRLAVAPSHQRNGLGQSLVADTLHWLQRQGVTTCWVNTQESNEQAFRFYTRLGFTPADHQLVVMRRPTSDEVD